LPETADFDAMPQNAINTGSIDFVLPPADMAHHLVQARDSYKRNNAYTDDIDLPYQGQSFKNILRVLQLRTGNDFSDYKLPTLRRRISRRMVINGSRTWSDYFDFLRTNV